MTPEPVDYPCWPGPFRYVTVVLNRQGTNVTREADNRSSAVKITDVAAAAGVAPMTVSRVINTPDRVSPETTAKVRAAIERLGYVPNLIAGGLSSRKSKMVAAVVPTIAHPMFSGVVQSFSATMRQNGYQVLLSISGYTDRDDESMFRALLGRRPDALLITGSGYTPGAIQMLMEARIPVVEVWDTSSRPIDMMVGFDHTQVGEEVAAFFLSRGFERFATLHAGDSRAVKRTRGFIDAIAKAGKPLVFEETLPAPSTIAVGRQGFRDMMHVLDQRCALFCSSDLTAFGVVTEARVHGIKVPEQLAVCGFGNLEIAEMSEPPITTVSLDGAGTGRTAAEFLLARLNGETTVESDKIRVPFEIIERATT